MILLGPAAVQRQGSRIRGMVSAGQELAWLRVRARCHRPRGGCVHRATACRGSACGSLLIIGKFGREDLSQGALPFRIALKLSGITEGHFLKPDGTIAIGPSGPRHSGNGSSGVTTPSSRHIDTRYRYRASPRNWTGSVLIVHSSWLPGTQITAANRVWSAPRCRRVLR
jgi:hypothetical protein